MATISHLLSFPLKSGAATVHTSLAFSPAGAAQDRLFCIRDDATQTMVSARDIASLSNIACLLNDSAMVLTDSVTGTSIQCSASQFGTVCQVKIWNNVRPALIAPPAINAWLSARLGRRVSLCRRRDELDNGDFFDTSPIHLINAESVRELGEYLGRPIPVEVFRPNIVITGLPALAENTLKAIVINGTEMRVLDECDRCSMVDTLLPAIARSPSSQDASVLEALRFMKNNGRLSFGLYLQAQTAATLHIGESVGLIAQP